MKRDDGVNRRGRVGTYGFVIDNPARVTVSKHLGRWRVFRGIKRLGSYETFSKAIAMAHGYARGSQS